MAEQNIDNNTDINTESKSYEDMSFEERIAYDYYNMTPWEFACKYHM